MERRLHERVPAYADCILLDSIKGIEHPGKLWNISEGGVCVVIFDESPPQIGDTCILQFADTPDNTSNSFLVTEPVVINNITRLEEGYRLGAAFVSRISQQCLSYIRVLSARALLRNHPFR